MFSLFCSDNDQTGTELCLLTYVSLTSPIICIIPWLVSFSKEPPCRRFSKAPTAARGLMATEAPYGLLSLIFWHNLLSLYVSACTVRNKQGTNNPDRGYQDPGHILPSWKLCCLGSQPTLIAQLSSFEVM